MWSNLGEEAIIEYSYLVIVIIFWGMERLKELLRNDGLIFLIMGVLAVLRDMLAKRERIIWRIFFTKFFVKVASGVGFYTFLLSYKPWYGEYPQKVGVIMIAVYIGDKVIDIFIEKGFRWLHTFDIRTFVKKFFDL